MKNTCLLLFAILFCLQSCAQGGRVVIANVDVFDGETLFENVDFVFNDSVIVSIGKGRKKYKHATVIDGTDKTILPPLINSHVHIAGAINLKEALGVGIFAMMDMFTVDRRANYLREFNDSVGFAHYYSSHVGATVPKGHGTQYGVAIPTISDTLSPEDFVKDRVRLGADYIKITQEHTMAKLTTEQLRGVIEETHRQGKIAVAHISALEGALELNEQHVDGLAHIWYRKPHIATSTDLDKMKKNGLFIIPTLSVIEKTIQYSEENNNIEEVLTFEQVLEEVKKVYEAGIPILAGTDARNFGMDYTTQYFKELVLLSRAGLSNIDVLKAGTSNIYRAFQLKEFGNLTKNATASFILVDGKPHLNIEDIFNSKKIWKGGVVVDIS